MLVSSLLLAALPLCVRALDLEPRGDLHFPLHARGTNKDASLPTYKNPKADIEARVADLLPRMTIEEKVAQLYVLFLSDVEFITEKHISIQGDINMYMNMTDPLDNTHTYNATGLAELMATRAGAVWAGYSTPWDKLVYTITVGQRCDVLVSHLSRRY
jgi:beta-glucosidase